MLDTFLCVPQLKIKKGRNIQFIHHIWLMDFGKKDAEKGFKNELIYFFNNVECKSTKNARNFNYHKINFYPFFFYFSGKTHVLTEEI